MGYVLMLAATRGWGCDQLQRPRGRSSAHQNKDTVHA